MRGFKTIMHTNVGAILKRKGSYYINPRGDLLFRLDFDKPIQVSGSLGMGAVYSPDVPDHTVPFTLHEAMYLAAACRWELAMDFDLAHVLRRGAEWAGRLECV